MTGNVSVKCLIFYQIKECCDSAELVGKSGSKPKAAAAPKAEAKKPVARPASAAKAAPEKAAPKKVRVL